MFVRAHIHLSYRFLFSTWGMLEKGVICATAKSLTNANISNTMQKKVDKNVFIAPFW